MSERTNVAMNMTHPIVGPGVNSISTGTPFVHPESFRPFDPEAVLGIRPTVVLSALASLRVVRAVASRLGFDLTDDEAKVALRWVKQTCYRHIAGTLDDEMFATFLRTQKLGTAA